MFIRSHKRFKNGKWHTYYSVVENRRCATGQHVQRQVLFLFEKLKLTLPEQPPPKIYASQLAALQEHLDIPEPRN
ncbi:MAG: hypothetical protein HKL96_11225 [Phycisphaerales bacterium]|nr:hypothetical protein [Phycisphaerales bacterium]